MLVFFKKRPTEIAEVFSGQARFNFLVYQQKSPQKHLIHSEKCAISCCCLQKGHFLKDVAFVLLTAYQTAKSTAVANKLQQKQQKIIFLYKVLTSSVQYHIILL